MVFLMTKIMTNVRKQNHIQNNGPFYNTNDRINFYFLIREILGAFSN